MPNNPELEKAWNLVKEAQIEVKKYSSDPVVSMLLGFAKQQFIQKIRLIHGDIGIEWQNGECHLSNGEVYK